MLKEEYIKIINEYVNPKFYDKNKLIDYLERNTTVGNEIFMFCFNDSENTSHIHNRMYALTNYDFFSPITIDTFVKRIPFYFHDENFDNKVLTDLTNFFGSTTINRRSAAEIEEIYRMLEYLLYGCSLSLYDIAEYIFDQTDSVDYLPFLGNWYNYLILIKNFNEFDIRPKNFITAYNYVLEKSNKEPIIYEVVNDHFGMFHKTNNSIVFKGIFPCAESGIPILRWIGIRVANVNIVTCTCKKSKMGNLTVFLTPNCQIQALNLYGSTDGKDRWNQVYSGPQNMELNFAIFKRRREQLGLTQQNVADAIECSLRTYQKWESGENIPDGTNLIRLLNWLDLNDIQEIIHYQHIQ